jgi:hypothetical protein
MVNKSKSTLLDALISIRTNPPLRTQGICVNLSQFKLVDYYTATDILHEVFNQWKDRRISSGFPVEGGVSQYSKYEDKYDILTNPYAIRRLNLLDHCIKTLGDELFYIDKSKEILDFRLLEILEKIKENVKDGTIIKEAGLCGNITSLINGSPSRPNTVSIKYYDRMTELFKLWPYYSGNFTYPIEGCFHKYGLQYNKFSSTTKYGRLRRNLLNFMIKELKSY